ncbi:MAG TPA: UDP-N-acetylmuramate--L-alanine ligase [Candidatus Paceibacterota bacterium]|nr:UDP-N-acetylmuramate--L-alanine ligase [Candidatus Paceibacterota bacterium]
MDVFAVKKAHFIGIGGIGISAIARMLIARGVAVSGSDQADGKVVSELKKLGATIHIGHAAENIPQDTELVVYTIAIPKDNAELVRASEMAESGMKVMTYPEALGAFSSGMYTIAIAGTHGKTTTTGMVASMLMHAKKEPTVIIGSFLKVPGAHNEFSNFIAGASDLLVVESCEYKRSFLNISPDIAVITNIDDDHLDYYKDLADIQRAFCEFVDRIKPGGVLITDVTHPSVVPVVEYAKGKNITVIDYTVGGFNGKLSVPGVHNRMNAKAAFEAGAFMGMDTEILEQGLTTFSGTWRRFEYKGVAASGAKIYDDYGHHPTEIKATLAAAREEFGDKAEIVAVFQPHLYSRTKEHFNEFAEAFTDANSVILLPIYAAREAFDPTVTHTLLADAARTHGTAAVAVGDFDEAVAKLTKELTPTSVLITIGAGDVYKVGDRLIHTLRE